MKDGREMGKFRDLTGQTFGRLTVVECIGRDKPGTYKWLCTCVCGKEVEITSNALLTGNSKSCGCSRKGRYIDLTGKVFGKLTVLEYVGLSSYDRPRWLCSCECGNTTQTNSANLTRGYTKSCGCLHKERTITANTTHNLTGTRTYKCWLNMKNRVTDFKNTHYIHYGGRGIKICERWLESFENFLEDMGECPKGMTLERLNNNGNYEPDNCEWASREIQSRNKRNSLKLSYLGTTKCACDWADDLNIPRSTVYARHAKGWSPEECLFGRSKKPSSNDPII